MTDTRMVKEVIPGAFEGNGIFSAFKNPIWCYDFDAAELDLCFITKYGEKWGSPFLMHFDGDNGITDENLEKLASSIYRICKSQWEHLWLTNNAEYNPIFNTEVHETETVERTGNENNIEGSTTESTVKANSNNEVDNTTENKSQGFNSSSYQPESKTDVDTSTATDGTNLSGGANESSSIKNYGDVETRKHDREGNIGTMTAAQLIEGDVKAWRWNYILGVMKDISDLIALSIY